MDSEPCERQLAQGMPVQGQAREGNGDRRPTQDVPVQGEPHEGNGNQRERRPTADQPRGRTPTPVVRVPEPTTIDAPIEAQMLTLMHRLSSDGRPRT
jgi:hypothetical protein